jgi:maltose O-acetyltransferase
VRLIKLAAVALYYGFARHLPQSSRPLGLGIIGRRTRGALCRCMFDKCGGNVNVERGASFGDGVGMSIGAYSGIGINARLNPAGGIVIGDDVMMGEDVVILTENHGFDDASKPMRLQGYQTSPVVIEDDVWIGLRVIILPGVRIGRSSVIGAGAVVANDIPAYSIAGGVPAKVIKQRQSGAPGSVPESS